MITSLLASRTIAVVAVSTFGSAAAAATTLGHNLLHLPHDTVNHNPTLRSFIPEDGSNQGHRQDQRQEHRRLPVYEREGNIGGMTNEKSTMGSLESAADMGESPVASALLPSRLSSSSMDTQTEEAMDLQAYRCNIEGERVQDSTIITGDTLFFCVDNNRIPDNDEEDDSIVNNARDRESPSSPSSLALSSIESIESLDLLVQKREAGDDENSNQVSVIISPIQEGQASLVTMVDCSLDGGSKCVIGTLLNPNAFNDSIDDDNFGEDGMPIPTPFVARGYANIIIESSPPIISSLSSSPSSPQLNAKRLDEVIDQEGMTAQDIYATNNIIQMRTIPFSLEFSLTKEGTVRIASRDSSLEEDEENANRSMRMSMFGGYMGFSMALVGIYF